jgi:predicted dehydrogenase
MTSDIKTVAVVGCGIGRSHIVDGYLANADRFKVVAICDINAERLAALADEVGVKRRVADYDDLLAMDDLDIIDICTPPVLHREQILKGLRAGKHVICEKPLVGSLAEVDEVVDAEANAKGRLMPIFQCRFGNGIQQVKRIIDAGIPGKPYAGTAETFWNRGAAYYAVPWRGKWASELGGIIMTHAIHIHDLLLYLMGPVRSLFGRVATRVNPIETEDCISASCQLESGALVSMTGTLGSQEQISRLRLAFENVSFESDQAPYRPGTQLWRVIPRSPEVAARIEELLTDWQDVPPGYASQLRLFHEALATGGPLPVTTADARRALELATAFYHSSRTRTEVTFPIVAGHPKYEGWLPTAVTA